MRIPKGIKYISLHGMLGYFFTARDYMLAFQDMNIPVTWQPLIPDRNHPGGFAPFKGKYMGEAQLDRFCNREIEYDTVIIHAQPEVYPYWLKKESGKCIIGYTVWETDRLPGTWPELINSMPRVLVPSTWNRNVFMNSGVTTAVGVVPHIFNSDYMGNSGLVKEKNSDFIFYTIEEWRARKGLDRTVISYLNAFTGEDRTKLLLKTSPGIYYQWQVKNPGILRKIYRRGRKVFNVPPQISIRPNAQQFVDSIRSKYKNPARIELITKKLSGEEVAEVHRRGDCYVSLCSSEGWGLGPFCAAGNGKVVIMTGYGGQLDYLTEDNSYLVDYKLVPVRDDEDPSRFTKNQNWAEPDLDKASEIMREVFEDPEKLIARGENLKESIHRKFNKNSIVKVFLDQINRTFI